MIYRLMKSDPAWRYTWIVTLASVAAFLLWRFFGSIHNFGLGVALPAVFSFIGMIAGIAAFEQQHHSSFQAALPITGRQIFTTRVLSMVLLLWLPVIGGLAALIGLREAPVASLLEFTAFYMLAILSLQAASAGGITISRWLFVVPAPILLAVGSEMLIGNWTLEKYAVAVVPFCWVASAAIFLWSRRTIPKSLRIAPVKPSPAREDEYVNVPARRKSASAWKPVLRSLFPMGGVWVLALFMQMQLTGCCL